MLKSVSGFNGQLDIPHGLSGPSLDSPAIIRQPGHHTRRGLGEYQ
ncbi:hypothetical protein SAMN05216330_106254 [Bradyrhizobium sp. Ghvi]|nr:hypothetical protein SAMN05216330_106254 [Bradyrhizobium sp. Ghvi]